MKNLVNYVVLVIAVLLLVLVMSKSVNASGQVLFPQTGASGNNTLGTDNNTLAATNTQPVSNGVPVTSINNNITKENVVNNTVNNNTTQPKNNTTEPEKKLPQTGENDVYIVSAVGVAALAIGTVAYVKSRKYDI